MDINDVIGKTIQSVTKIDVSAFADTATEILFTDGTKTISTGSVHWKGDADTLYWKGIKESWTTHGELIYLGNIVI